MTQDVSGRTQPFHGPVGLAAARWLVLAVGLVLLFATTARAAAPEVSITDEGFKPLKITVTVGEPVTWTNTSSETDHAITSKDGTLDSGELAPGEAYGHVFEKPGTYTYRCALHPDEKSGTVIVVAAGVTPAPAGTPEPTPPAGTLPPDFSPFPSTEVPTPTPAPAATPAPTTPTTAAPSAAPSGGPGASPSADPGTTGSGSGDTGGPGILLLVLLLVAAGAGAAVLVRGRKGQPPAA